MLAKLNSRKFTTAVVTTITLLLNKQFEAAAAVAVAYLAAEGYIDGKAAQQ